KHNRKETNYPVSLISFVKENPYLSFASIRILFSHLSGIAGMESQITIEGYRSLCSAAGRLQTVFPSTKCSERKRQHRKKTNPPQKRSALPRFQKAVRYVPNADLGLSFCWCPSK
ncbi:MAG TPA: hypothetical protein H9915_07255, partial [Candidatus Gemmiger faecigallinarum]|nr:hypothetical protein [Candidatus Gemmiger faecigallinarum]